MKLSAKLQGQADAGLEWWAIENEEGQVVATVAPIEGAAALARLLAAAPKLVKVCKAALARFREINDIMDIDSYYMERRLEEVLNEVEGA